MIVGNGMLANSFNHYKESNDVLIFASGVSNSKNIDTSQFNRELSILNNNIELLSENTFFIYFSTTSINDPELKNSSYVLHKLNIEDTINKKVKNFIIFRLSNIVGKSKNSNTIFNYLINKINNNEDIEIWKYAERNFVSIDQLVQIIDLFIGNRDRWNKKIINIANFQNIKVTDLLEKLQIHFKKNISVKVIEKGIPYSIDLSILKFELEKQIPNFNFFTIEKLINIYA